MVHLEVPPSQIRDIQVEQPMICRPKFARKLTPNLKASYPILN